MLGHEPPSHELSACASLARRFPHRALLAVPDVRHIPTFAMRAEKARAPFEWARLGSFDQLRAIAGRDAAERLQAGRYGAYRVIDTRTRLDRKTALYAPWCVFAAAGHARAFERDHLHLGLAALSKRAEAVLKALQAADQAQPDPALEALRSRAGALSRLRHLLKPERPDQPSSWDGSCSP